jgi:ornithine cyclodeaminase
MEAGVISNEDEVIELGELTSRRKPGREAETDITVCDLTGVGVQDTQIARLVYVRAVERGFGQSIV